MSLTLRSLLVAALSCALLLWPAAAGAEALSAASAQLSPCTRTWDGGAGTTSWHDAANWLPDGAPGAGDDVCIDAPATVVQFSGGFTTVRSIQAERPLGISGGFLTITGASALNAGIQLSGGTLVPNGQLTIGGASTWTGGQLSGTGEITNTGSLSVTGAGAKLIKNHSGGEPDTRLRNTGTITQTGIGVLRLEDGRIINLAGGLYDLQSSNGSTPLLAKGQAFTDHGFENYGTFRRSIDPGTAVVEVAFGNHGGTIEAQTGTLQVGLFGTGGAIEVASGALIRVPAAATWSGTWTGSGPGLVRFELGTSPPMPISGAGATFSFPFEFASGIIQPNGPWTITRSMLWTGGSIGFTTSSPTLPQVNLTNTATLTLAGATDKFLKGSNFAAETVLNNAGTIVHTGTGVLDFENGRLNNLAGGVYRLEGDAGLTRFQGGHLFVNNGTVRKTQGTATTFGVFLDNAGGTVAVDTGTLSLTGGVATSGGTLEASAGAVLNVASGGNWTGTTSGAGAGTVRFTGGTMRVPASDSAAFNFTGSGWEKAGGLFRLEGVLTNQGRGAWTGGTIMGSGGLSNQGTLSISGTGGNKLLQTDFPADAVINNAGTINHSSGAVGMYYGRINNQPGGLYDLTGTAELYRYDFGGHAFFNFSTLRASAGTPAVNVQLDNGAGTVEVLAGATLSVPGMSQATGGALTSGRYVIAGTFVCCGSVTKNAATVILDGPALQFAALNQLNTNNGTLELRNGRSFSTIGGLTNSGTLKLGSASRLTVGSSGATYSQSSSGALSLDLAGPIAGTTHGQLAVRGPVSLGGGLVLNSVGGYAPGPADALVFVDNDLADAIGGTFSGLPEGALVTIGSVQRAITYIGGSGNDVALGGDTTPPPAPAVAAGPAEGSLTNATTATFDFTSSEAGVTFQCSLDGAAFTVCQGPMTYSGLASGTHTFAVRSVDAAGNVGPATVRTWTVDATPPAAPSITSGPAEGSSSTQNSASFGFSGEAGATFQCSLDGAPFTACASGVSYSGLAVGTHQFQVRAADAAGNVGPAATRSWKVEPLVLTCTVTATPSSVWPPNHKLVEVRTTVTVSAGASGFRLVSVTSNEPDNGQGDGDEANDIQGWEIGTADTAGQLRAERSGKGDGRVYTITYAVLDGSGNAAGHCSTTVSVPKEGGR